MRVLLTGGAGYIGSHTALVLLQDNHEVVVLDDLSNGNIEALDRVEQITGQSIEFVQGDLTNPCDAGILFKRADFDAVIHFAGLKAVAESVLDPMQYYRVNLQSTFTLLEMMRENDVKNLVFSSSATVYGKPQTPMVDETHPVGVGLTNPYAWSKAMNEQIIHDVSKAWPEFSAVNLRYFNPVGAHLSGHIGEDPSGVPNNLVPFIAQVAVGRRSHLSIFGDDYDTHDGTGVRDYIHVMDLAEGHVAALLQAKPGLNTYNLGSGRGTSVFEALRTFERISGKQIAYEVSPRRSGDLATVVANPKRAKAELSWQTTRTFEDACQDAWTWQALNPNGYASV